MYIKCREGIPFVAQLLVNPTNIREDLGSIPGLPQWAKGSSVAMSCGVGHRHISDPTLLWLWCRPVATAPIQPLAWEPPHAAGAALKKTKKKKRAEGSSLRGSVVNESD